ncbi:MAG: hypothetical protein AAF919_19345 [Pseudomonadota bacterium]
MSLGETYDGSTPLSRDDDEGFAEYLAAGAKAAQAYTRSRPAGHRADPGNAKQNAWNTLQRRPWIRLRADWLARAAAEARDQRALDVSDADGVRAGMMRLTASLRQAYLRLQDEGAGAAELAKVRRLISGHAARALSTSALAKSDVDAEDDVSSTQRGGAVVRHAPTVAREGRCHDCGR